MSACPLCEQEIKKRKVVYGNTICKKCWAGYINRRQVAYIIDMLLVFAATMLIGAVMVLALGNTGLWVQFFVAMLLNVYWLGRDGMNGRSPGKVCMNMVAIDDSSGEPIGWKQAFIRNWPLAISMVILLVANALQISFFEGLIDDLRYYAVLAGIGVIVALMTVVVIAIQMNAGPRWGDGWANTRVIWRRYAESPVFNPTLAQSLALAPEFAPAMRNDARESTNDPYRAPRT